MQLLLILQEILALVTDKTTKVVKILSIYLTSKQTNPSPTVAVLLKEAIRHFNGKEN